MKANLLILDELSYLSFNKHQSDLLFKVISDHSKHNNTIATTNLPFSRWTELFENTTMAAALVDRLTFRSHVPDTNGDSYRLKASRQNPIRTRHKPTDVPRTWRDGSDPRDLSPLPRV